MSNPAGKTLEAPRPQAGKKVEVKITLDAGTGDITCTPNPVRVGPEGMVEWTCDDGPWAVMPVRLTPFDVRIIQGGKGEKKGAKPSSKAPFGRYEYVVAVERNGKIWLEDPELIFGPPR